MNKLLLASIAALSFAALDTQAARATVLTFDDVANWSAVPNGYGGFNWNTRQPSAR